MAHLIVRWCSLQLWLIADASVLVWQWSMYKTSIFRGGNLSHCAKVKWSGTTRLLRQVGAGTRKRDYQAFHEDWCVTYWSALESLSYEWVESLLACIYQLAQTVMESPPSLFAWTMSMDSCSYFLSCRKEDGALFPLSLLCNCRFLFKQTGSSRTIGPSGIIVVAIGNRDFLEEVKIVLKIEALGCAEL